jgi:hypothetical protein
VLAGVVAQRDGMCNVTPISFSFKLSSSEVCENELWPLQQVKGKK